MSLIDDCERCSAPVERQGDHICADCARALGRSVRDPFWGAFASHPDSELRRGFTIANVCDDLLRRSANG